MATTYDPQVYAKYLKAKITEEGCSECGDATEACSDCCPPGLVSVKDDEGNHLGCLTPDDATTFMAANHKCATEGYLVLIKTATSEFLGCVPSTEFAALYATVNP